MNLELLFTCVRKRAQALRKRSDFDGLKFWQGIKKELVKLDANEASSWKSLNEELTKKIGSLSEYTINDSGETIMIESCHFLKQQVRIPGKCPPTIRKIIQLALNIGQWQGSLDDTLMEHAKYSASNLANISEYISKKDIVYLSNKIPQTTMDTILKYLSTY